MNQKKEAASAFMCYEYKEITVPADRTSLYMDCYENFGWLQEDRLPAADVLHHTILRMKRDRKIVNKMELTRLQRHFEACAAEIEALEHSKTSAAAGWAITAGILGTAFMAGSVFAVTHQPPMIFLCVLLAIPGLTGWILPCFLYRRIAAKKSKKVQPMIEAKEDEIYSICEKAHSLLY